MQWASVFSWGKSFISHYLIKAFDNLQPAVHHLTMAGNTAKIHVVLQGFKNDHGGIAFFYHGLTAQIQRFHDNVMSHQFTVDQRYFYTLDRKSTRLNSSH